MSVDRFGGCYWHPHMQWEHVVVLPGQDLVAGLHDQPVSSVVQPPVRVVAVGAALFSVAYAVIISSGIRCCPMLRCSSERWVCAPPTACLPAPRPGRDY